MITTNSLTFASSQTIAEFKAAHNVSEIKIKQNPDTMKVYFTTSNGSGKVSTKWQSAKPTVISNCVDSSTGESFLMLHNENDTHTVLNVLR